MRQRFCLTPPIAALLGLALACTLAGKVAAQSTSATPTNASHHRAVPKSTSKKPVTGITPTALGRALPEQMRLVHTRNSAAVAPDANLWLGSSIDDRLKQLQAFLVLDGRVLTQARCDEAFFLWAEAIVMGCKRGTEAFVETVAPAQSSHQFVAVDGAQWQRWMDDAALWRASARSGMPAQNGSFKPEEANHLAAFVGVYRQGAWQSAPLRAWEATAQHLTAQSRWAAIINAKPLSPGPAMSATDKQPLRDKFDAVKSDPRMRFAQSFGPDALQAALAGQPPSPQRVNLRGENLLYYALLDTKDASLAKQLIDDGIDTRWVSAYGERNALMLAAGNSTPDVVQAILARGGKSRTKGTGVNMNAQSAAIDVNAQSAFGLTALMYAAGAGRIGNARVLLTASANKDVKDNKGRRALDIAREAKQDLMVEVLGP
jgi:Ankyrin repeats (many copies)